MLAPFPRVSNENYVLVIEDSPIDFEIICRTFKKVEFLPQMLHWDNGSGALDFLLDLADKKQANRMPSLVLLDLNMPGVDGREILLNIKNNKALQHIPVIVLSTSNNEGDIEFSYRQGAEKFLRKPITLEDFADVARTIKQFWETQVVAHF